MTLNLNMPTEVDLRPRITVFGVGGAGGNAVDNMIEKQLEGVEFVSANTDSQALSASKAPKKIQMGVKVTEGLGAGARPSVGAAAAEETIEEIVDHLAGAHMCFITAGMGGGTGTGAAPIIAQAARELGVLTVGVVTKPFQFEGAKRMRQAEEGVESLQKMVDTLIIIPNQNLFRLANEKTTFTEAFSMADDVLYQGVKGVTDLMVRPGLINLDFADVRAVMDEMGKAMMGTGEAEGEDRATQAAEKAIANPLLDEISLKGAHGVLINITGGTDLTLFELDEAANRIREEVDPNANIIVGSTMDTEMDGMMRVSVVATGIDAADVTLDVPVPRRRLSEPLGSAVPMDNGAPTSDFDPVEPEAEEVTEDDGPLFSALEEPAVQNTSDMGLFSDDVDDGADMVPPPAYQPEASVAEDVAYADSDDMVADTDFGAGNSTPAPETLARLQAAVQRGSTDRAPAREADADKPRFGINTLIHRMTGHHEDEEPTASAAPARRQPPVSSPAAPAASTDTSRLRVEDDTFSPEDERIEIPAFLRRQAN
ncbi:MAG: cell division protein FtsZ [Rhodobacteraceae bacterium]|nr:cell division protein FtsZ [Paracoccaceae bacterium]